jgi:hypothetical protein
VQGLRVERHFAFQVVFDEVCGEGGLFGGDREVLCPGVGLGWCWFGLEVRES